MLNVSIRKRNVLDKRRTTLQVQSLRELAEFCYARGEIPIPVSAAYSSEYFTICSEENRYIVKDLTWREILKTTGMAGHIMNMFKEVASAHECTIKS